MNISSADLRRAATIKDKIEQLQVQLSKLLGGIAVENGLSEVRTAKAGRRGRRKMSAAAKAKIAAAQRARWAKLKAARK